MKSGYMDKDHELGLWRESCGEFRKWLKWEEFEVTC